MGVQGQGGGRQLAAAAALSPLSPRQRLAWLLAAMLVQSVWGLMSVCTRYLQSQAPVLVPPLQLSAVIAIICWPGTALICYLPVLCSRLQITRARAQPSKQQQQQQPGMAARTHSCTQLPETCQAAGGQVQQGDVEAPPPPGPATSSSRGISISATSGAAAEAACPAAHTAAAPQPSSSLSAGAGQPVLHRAKVQALALAVGFPICLAALGLVYATEFIPAYLVQLMMLLIPLLTAVANRVVLRQPTPHLLWPFLGLTAVGSVLVIAGEWLEHGQPLAASGHGAAASMPRSTSLLVGVGISLASAALFAAYFTALQATRALVPTRQQLMGSRNIALIVLIPLALGVEGSQWHWLWRLRPADWAVLLFAAVVAYTLGTAGLQCSTRALGGVVVAQFNSMRLVSAIVGSVVLLGEVPRSAIMWAGFVVVVGSMAAWLLLQAHHGCRNKQELQQQQQQGPGSQAQLVSAGGGSVVLVVGDGAASQQPQRECVSDGCGKAAL